MVIETSRLTLHLISVEDLLTLDSDPTNPALFKNKSFTNPNGVLETLPSPVRFRAPQVRENPELNFWFIRWIVEKETQVVVGSISFHGPPNEVGMIEVGLGIDKSFRGKGYAKEALLGFWSWVIQQENVKILRYTVSAKNLASMAIIKFFEFNHVGQQIDDEDGPEEIFEMSCKDFADNIERFKSKLGS